MVELGWAIELNRKLSERLGWREHMDSILQLFSATLATGEVLAAADEQRFASLVVEWQALRTLNVDGIVGDDTWGTLASALGLGVRNGHWKPLGAQTEPLLLRHDIVCLHTMAGTLAGTDAHFRKEGYTGTDAHFGVGHDGTVFQWQDTRFETDALLDGNRRAISIETEDYGPAFPLWDPSDSSVDNVPAWTAMQISKLGELTARCCIEFSIPISQVPDSSPYHRGIAYHRQGVPPWIKSSGEKWSSGPKVCPGAKRIAQIPEVIQRAQHVAQYLRRVSP